MPSPRPVTFVYAAATLVATIVPPALARLLVFAIMVTGTALTVWVWRAPDMILGLVERADSTATFAAIDPLLPGDQVVVQLPEAHGSLRANDLLFATGGVKTVVGQPVGAIFEASTAAWLPISQARLPGITEPLPEINAVGIALVAGALTLFAQLTLRLAGVALFGAISAVFAFMAVNLAQWTGTLPIPPDLVHPVSVTGAAMGAVLAFKATTGERLHIAQRVAAVLLAFPLMAIAQDAGLPEMLGWSLPLFALVWPVVVPVAAAAIALFHGFDLGHAEATAAFAGLLVLRWPPLARLFRAAPTAPQAEDLTPDSRGEIDLDRILAGKES